MTSCCDMKEGDTYKCEGCGMELKVIKECDSCDEHDCKIECCGKELVKK